MSEKNPGLWDRVNSRVRRDLRNTPIGDLYRLLKKPNRAPQTTQQNSPTPNTPELIPPQHQLNSRPAQSQRQQGNYPVQTTLPARPGTQPIPEQPYQPPENQPLPEPETNPSPSTNVDSLKNPQLDKQIRQAERERVQREQQEREKERRDQIRENQRNRDQAKKDQAERAESDRLRKESDRRSDKIIDEIAESTERNRRAREDLWGDGRFKPQPSTTNNSPFDGSNPFSFLNNSSFGGPTSQVLQTSNSSGEVSFGDKLVRAIAMSVGTGVLKKEFLESMQKILTPESLAAIGGLLAVVGSANIAAAAFGGPIGAGISTAVSGAMATLVVGGNITTVVQATCPLFGFLTKAYGATTEAEFLAAANDFAKFVNVVGPDVVLNMTGAKAGKALGAISGKLASLGSELAGLSPERQKQIRNGLESGRKLLDSLGENIQGGFKSIFNSIDDALKHLSGEKKAANNLAQGGDGKLPSGNGKKPEKPPEVTHPDFPAGSPIKAKPVKNPALKTSAEMQDWIILNIEKRLTEKQAALTELAKAKAARKSPKELEKINNKIDQADDALVNAGAAWKLAEEGVDITQFEKKVLSSKSTGGTVAEADIAGKKWWVETGNGTSGKLDQVVKAISNAEANVDRKSLIAYIPKFSESAAKQIDDAGGYAVRDYKELSDLVKKAERGELAVLNPNSSLGRQFKAVTEKAILPFDFKTLDSALSNAVSLDKGKSGVRYGYIITKQDSKILIPGSKATVLPVPGKDNQGVIVKFTPKGRNGNPPYDVELMVGQVAPAGLVYKLTRELNLGASFREAMKNQTSLPKGIHDYKGVIDRDNKSIAEGLNKEIYTTQLQPSVGEQLRAKMDAQKLALGWVGNEPNTQKTAGSVNNSIAKAKMLADSLSHQNRLREALINQGKELELSEMKAQAIARASEISSANNRPRPKQNQREM
jgi:hypothetical protein